MGCSAGTCVDGSSCEKPVRVFDEYATYPTPSEVWRWLSRRSDADRHAPANAHATGARRRSWFVETVNLLRRGRFTQRLNPVVSVHHGSRRRMNRLSRLSSVRLQGRSVQVVTAPSPVKPARRGGPLPLGGQSTYRYTVHMSSITIQTPHTGCIPSALLLSHRPMEPLFGKECSLMSTLQAAIYARVSSEQQAEANTIARQVSALQERAQADSMTVSDALTFLDDG